MVTPVAETAISYIVDNDKKFRNSIQRALDATGDLRVPFTLIAADFYRSEQAIFQLKSPGQYPDYKPDPKGGPSRYAALKERAVGFKYPLLVRTGKLATSLLSKDASGSVCAIGPSELVIGTTVDYGIYHQSDEPRHKIPQRKFLFIGPEAPRFATSDQMGRAERWMNILNDHVLRAFKNGEV